MSGPRMFLSPPHMSGQELRYIEEAFASNYVAPAGPQIDAFERAFAELSGIAHCAAVASGTAAIHLALRLLGIERGDRVWASSLTFIGSVAPVVYEGAQLMFFDCDPHWTLDFALLEEELRRASKRGELPSAIIPTDLYGQCCDLGAIIAAADRYDIPVIADSAEAVGARYKGRHAGAGARAATYSFNGNKIITTSGGGIIASDDGALIERARYLAQAARQPVAHYEHVEVGYNYRLSNISAAIGRGQLEVLEERVNRRREIFQTYQRLLASVPGISFMPEAPYGRGNRWLTVILVDETAFGRDREDIRMALEAENIEARPVWKPMHLQPVFNGTPYKGGTRSEAFFANGLCLPSGSQMSDSDIERVAHHIGSLRK
jgi:dTDP-4-amino-4,6-dideoxygalactose transaminase